MIPRAWRAAARALFLAVALPALVAACAAPAVDDASPEEVAQAAYRPSTPPRVTLFTMVNNRSNSGAHSALMVSGSERVIFDPAGNWKHPQRPERGDVHYGIDNRTVDYFIDAHARITYRVVMHEIDVAPETAERLLQRVKSYGTVPQAFCSNAVSDVLSQTPEFASVSRGYFPKQIMRDFAALPGVRETVFRDDDPDDKDFVTTRYVN